MSTLNPYINFPGNTREAMTFYQSCLGGKLDLQVVAGSPFEAQCPPAMHHHIFHAELRHNAIVLMASDMQDPTAQPSSPASKPVSNVALSMDCSSEAEIRDLFEKLSEGGHVMHPCQEMFWGALFAAFTDRFGIRWMLNFALVK